jgi:hypothetical protein
MPVTQSSVSRSNKIKRVPPAPAQRASTREHNVTLRVAWAPVPQASKFVPPRGEHRAVRRRTQVCGSIPEDERQRRAAVEEGTSLGAPRERRIRVRTADGPCPLGAHPESRVCQRTRLKSGQVRSSPVKPRPATPSHAKSCQAMVHAQDPSTRSKSPNPRTRQSCVPYARGAGPDSSCSTAAARPTIHRVTASLLTYGHAL